VIIEAWASGVPVVATNVGGVTDIITHEKNGLLVAPEDTDSMTDAVMRLLKDDELSEKIAVCARSDVEQRYTLDLMLERTLEVYEKALKQFKILIIKLGAVGDVVLSIPGMRAIKKKFPDAHITVLTGTDSSQILRKCPYVDELIIYNKKIIGRGIGKFLKLAADLRRHDFDVVVDLQNNSRSHILGFLSKAPVRFGYANRKMGFLLNYAIEDTKVPPLAPVEHSFRVLNMMGIKYENDPLELWPAEADRDFARRLLSENWVGTEHDVIAINPAASKKWKTKNWPVENFARLCDMLAAKNIRIVIVSSKENRPEVDKLLAHTKSKPIDICGKTNILQLAAVLQRCKVLVSADSAPIHVACAVKTPIVALFGPTDPNRHSPPAGERITILRKNLRCSPCYKPNCTHLKCMNSITVDEVFEAVTSI